MTENQNLDDVMDADVTDAWVEELNRREEEIRSGHADGRPVDEFMAEMFEKYATD